MFCLSKDIAKLWKLNWSCDAFRSSHDGVTCVALLSSMQLGGAGVNPWWPCHRKTIKLFCCNLPIFNYLTKGSFRRAAFDAFGWGRLLLCKNRVFLYFLRQCNRLPHPHLSNECCVNDPYGKILMHRFRDMISLKLQLGTFKYVLTLGSIYLALIYKVGAYCGPHVMDHNLAVF